MSALRPSAPRRARAPHPRRESQAGVALLMVMTAVAVLTIVIVDFSRSAITHMNEGAYVRDEVRANAVADTALDLTPLASIAPRGGPLGRCRGR